MAEDWYKSRTPRNAGYQARECRIALPPHLWELFDKKARHFEWSRSKLASSLVYISLNQEVLERANRTAEAFAADKARNGDDSWDIRE